MSTISVSTICINTNFGKMRYSSNFSAVHSLSIRSDGGIKHSQRRSHVYALSSFQGKSSKTKESKLYKVTLQKE